MIETLKTLYEAAGHELPTIPQRIWQPQSLDDLDRWMDVSAGGYVDSKSALRVATIWACINVLPGDLAKLPLRTFRRDAENNRELARNHYLHDLLRWRANPEMSAYRFKRLMQVWLLTHGNAYAEIEISGRGQVVALWPWSPERTSVERVTQGGPLVYTYRLKTGEPVSVPANRMFHLRGLEVDGVCGVSPLEAFRRRIALSDSMEQHNLRFYESGGALKAVLEYPGELSPTAKENLEKSYDKRHGGVSNAYRLMILEEGMKLHEVGIKMADAQFVDTMNFGVEEITRIYNVPPHRIQHLLRSTNNNIEHQGIEYVQYSLGPWGENWQQEIQQSLLSEREAKTIYTEFDYTELLKGDFKAQAEYIRARWATGSLSADEIRQMYNENPLPDGMGRRPRVPSNTVWADEPNNQGQPSQPEPPEPEPRYLNGHARPELSA